MEKIKHEELIRIGRKSPEEVIDFVDNSFPKYNGLCQYDSVNRSLMSLDVSSVDFYYDPIHGVIHITEFEKDESKQ